MKFLGTVRQRNFDRKSSHNPLMLKIYSISEYSETLKRPLMKFFGILRQNILDIKSWYSLPPLASPLPYPLNFSIPEIFWQTGGSPIEVSEYYQAKKVWRKTLILSTFPRFLSINFFATRNFLEHSIEGFPNELFGIPRHKNDRKSGHNPLKQKMFRYSKIVTN